MTEFCGVGLLWDSIHLVLELSSSILSQLLPVHYSVAGVNVVASGMFDSESAYGSMLSVVPPDQKHGKEGMGGVHGPLRYSMFLCLVRFCSPKTRMILVSRGLSIDLYCYCCVGVLEYTCPL